MKRMKSIQVYKTSLIECVLQYKRLMNILHDHYRIKACIKYLPSSTCFRILLSLFIVLTCQMFFLSETFDIT